MEQLSLEHRRRARWPDKLALCLSGGGYRAALFHLGAVRRLNEVGLLAQFDAIASVSGGSILAAHLKPWAMAEVFLIGVVVALVKIGGMATVDLGPAFWAMAGLVVLVVYEGASLCEWSIWQTLERLRES